MLLIIKYSAYSLLSAICVLNYTAMFTLFIVMIE